MLHLPTLLTPSFVRPESIQDGKHRFFMSDQFNNHQPGISHRIRKDLNAAAIQIASEICPDVRPAKRKQVDHASPSPQEDGAQANAHSRASDIPSITSARLSTQDTPDSKFNSEPLQLPHFPLDDNVIYAFSDLLSYVQR